MTVEGSDSNNVPEPPLGAFDAILEPGEPLQSAVDGLRAGGSLLLAAGTHEGPLLLGPKEVHIFGRGEAVLQASEGDIVVSSAPVATLDGVIVRRSPGGEASTGVWVKGGGLRLQRCDVSSAAGACVTVSEGSDPVITGCKCVVQGMGGGSV